MLSHFASSGQPRTLVFPEGQKADGWFGVANFFKKVLIDANRPRSSKQQKTSPAGFSKVSKIFSYADALRGRVGKSKSTILKGWRCRDCGSWDVVAAVIGEHSGSVHVTPQQRGHEASNLGDKDRGSSGHRTFGADSRVEDEDRQFQPSSEVNGAGLRTSLSSQRSLDEDYVFASPVSNKFQVLRDLKENYPCSEGELFVTSHCLLRWCQTPP